MNVGMIDGMKRFDGRLMENERITRADSRWRENCNSDGDGNDRIK
jgi:hypothetical protein